MIFPIAQQMEQSGSEIKELATGLCVN